MDGGQAPLDVAPPRWRRARGLTSSNLDRPPLRSQLEVVTMRVVHERCAGLDVHKSSVVACALLPEGKQLRTFGTLTWQLEQLADRKSTRLNSSHQIISYAVFCLKKK